MPLIGRRALAAWPPALACGIVRPADSLVKNALAVSNLFSFLPRFYPKSFLRLLLAGFMLVALPAIFVLLHTLYALDQVASESRIGIEHAARLTGGGRQMAEHSVVMERAVRQYLVLEEKNLLQRYREARQHARQTALSLRPLASPALAIRLDEWLEQDEVIASTLARVPLVPEQGQKVIRYFSHLAEVSHQIVQVSQGQVDAQANRLLAQIDRQKHTLTLLLFAVVAAAILLAVFLSHVLHRPVRQMDKAIRDLGDGLLNEPIHIKGPADVEYLGERLEWLRGRLAGVEQEKQRFLRDMAFELKAPLSAIRESVELLDTAQHNAMPLSNERQQDVLTLMKDNSQTLHTLIEDLLAYNTARLVTPPLANSSALAEVLQQAFENWQRRLIQQRLSWSVMPNLHAPFDGGIVVAIIDKLLTHAVAASPAESEIVIKAYADNVALHIECHDAGCLITEAERRRVFDPFFRSSRRHTPPRQGGIHLALVRRYAEQLGGTAQVLPSDHGALFHIALPLHSQLSHQSLAS